MKVSSMKDSLFRAEVDPRRIRPERPGQGWQEEAVPRIKRSVLSDQVSKVIIDGLLSGRFQPGDRLVESELAALLGVSRSPIREALTELAQSGVVESAPGRGCRIRNWSMADLEELFAVRGLLEGYAARLACTRFGREEKATFALIIADMQIAGQRSDFAFMIVLFL
jgi:DNA-binding GntR family transcriptional regulator